MIDLSEVLLSLQDRSEIEAFLPALFSPSEMAKFDKRLDLFRRVYAGQPHRSIAADLGVGVATVSRAAAALRAHGDIIERVLRRAEAAVGETQKGLDAVLASKDR